MAPGGFSRWPGGGPGMKIFENFSKSFCCPKCVQNEYLGGKSGFEVLFVHFGGSLSVLRC